MGESQGRYESFGAEINLLPLLGIEPRFFDRLAGTIVRTRQRYPASFSKVQFVICRNCIVVLLIIIQTQLISAKFSLCVTPKDYYRLTKGKVEASNAERNIFVTGVFD